MTNEFYTRLGIYSKTLTPSQVNSILGIKCDKGYRVGDIRKPTTIREKENGWVIKSRLSREVPLADHIKDLLERTSPMMDKIRRLADQPDVKVEFSCVVFTSERPEINFLKEEVAAICSIGASLDIDLYILPEEEKVVAGQVQ